MKRRGSGRKRPDEPVRGRSRAGARRRSRRAARGAHAAAHARRGRRAGRADRAGPSPSRSDRPGPPALGGGGGREGLTARARPLRKAIARARLRSIVLGGPPGTGKTTLARLIASTTRAHFVAFSAVLSGIKEIRDVMAEAERARR